MPVHVPDGEDGEVGLLAHFLEGQTPAGLCARTQPPSQMQGAEPVPAPPGPRPSPPRPGAHPACLPSGSFILLCFSPSNYPTVFSAVSVFPTPSSTSLPVLYRPPLLPALPLLAPPIPQACGSSLPQYK